MWQFDWNDFLLYFLLAKYRIHKDTCVNLLTDWLTSVCMGQQLPFNFFLIKVLPDCWATSRYMYMYVSLYESFNIFHGWCGVWFHSYHARLEVIRVKKLPCGGRLHFLVGQKQSSSHLCCGNFLDGENRSDHKESFQHVTNHWQVCNNASTPYQELQSNSELTVVTWYNQNDLLFQ